jgi:hypothetical protein
VTQNIEFSNYLIAKVNGKSIRGLVDTGSGTTLIKTAVVHKLKLSIRPVQTGELSCLFAAEGSKIIVDGIADVTFNIFGLFIAHSVGYTSILTLQNR